MGRTLEMNGEWIEVYLVKTPEIQDEKRTAQPFKNIGSIFHLLEIYRSLCILCKLYHFMRKAATPFQF